MKPKPNYSKNVETSQKTIWQNENPKGKKLEYGMDLDFSSKGKFKMSMVLYI